MEPGQFVAIVGGTGVGKSSLVNLIPRFYDVTGGAVLLDGVDVRDYPLEELRARIGMVLQSNVLFSGTVRDNLLWGKPDATEDELIQAARDAQAYDFIMSFPDGFDTSLSQGGVNVSGGQKQRLLLAIAVASNRNLLVFDEPTSGLDGYNMRLTVQLFKQLAKEGKCVLLITHDMDLIAEAADCVLYLEQGKVRYHRNVLRKV